MNPLPQRQQVRGGCISGGACSVAELNICCTKYGGEGAPDDQQLRWPSGFVLVPDGRIFVSEAQGAKIRVISPDHKSMRVITSPALQHAATIAVVEE